jgi:hypothetical protein
MSFVIHPNKVFRLFLAARHTENVLVCLDTLEEFFMATLEEGIMPC